MVVLLPTQRLKLVICTGRIGLTAIMLSLLTGNWAGLGFAIGDMKVYRWIRIQIPESEVHVFPIPDEGAYSALSAALKSV